MKKLLSTLFCVSMLAAGTQIAMANEIPSKDFGKMPPKERINKQKPPMFNLEEALNLTEKQKKQAKENRIQGRKEMKPVMDEIRAKKEAIMDIMDSDLTPEQQKEKIKPLKDDIKALHIKANELRKKNMQNFEKILTKEQKAKFEEMKKQAPKPKKCQKCAKKMPKKDK